MWLIIELETCKYPHRLFSRVLIMEISTEEVSHGAALKDSPFIGCETHKY